jgi:hypothetical protein
MPAGAAWKAPNDPPVPNADLPKPGVVRAAPVWVALGVAVVEVVECAICWKELVVLVVVEPNGRLAVPVPVPNGLAPEPKGVEVVLVHGLGFAIAS